MNYSDLLGVSSCEVKGIGDEPNEVVTRAAKASFVSRHKGYKRSQQDEHDRFMPVWFNNMSVPVNTKDQRKPATDGGFFIIEFFFYICYNEKVAGVVEWQTRWSQKPMPKA